jgi:hypothetical protein
MIGREVALERIWADDKLGRVELAQQLEDYIHARFKHPAPGGGSFTIAVEGPYGLGKSFFLERLERQLSLTFPVAFVNAWADDCADDPLTSLFLSIEAALAEKVVTQSAERRKRAAKQLKEVAKIAAKVVVRAAGARLLTEKGLDELESAYEAGVDDLFNLKKLGDAVQPLVSRRNLISEFKTKLTALLEAMEADNLFCRPLVIVIDELDRCRPTYAIRILEEAKHFFDDTGTVFVYGMNRRALVETVRAIYGSEFPANEYLARFVRRQVSLPENSLKLFIEDEFRRNSHLVSKFLFPDANGENDESNLANWLSMAFANNAIRARDAEYVLEHILSFAAMWEHEEVIHIPYLAALAIGHYKSFRGDGSGSVARNLPQMGSVSGDSIFETYQTYGAMDLNAILHRRQGIRSEQAPVVEAIINGICNLIGGRGSYNHHNHSTLRSQLTNYQERLRNVGKFLVLPEVANAE